MGAFHALAQGLCPRTACPPPISQVFSGHEDAVTCGDFDPSGRIVVSGSADSRVRVFNPKTAACLHAFSMEGPVNVVACHPAADVPLWSAGCQDGTAAVLNVATRKVVARVNTAPAGVAIGGGIGEDDVGCSVER